MLIATRQWYPAPAVPALLDAGWRLVYETPGGAHPIVRPAGALLERSAGGPA